MKQEIKEVFDEFRKARDEFYSSEVKVNDLCEELAKAVLTEMGEGVKVKIYTDKMEEAGADSIWINYYPKYGAPIPYKADYAYLKDGEVWLDLGRNIYEDFGGGLEGRAVEYVTVNYRLHDVRFRKNDIVESIIYHYENKFGDL